MRPSQIEHILRAQGEFLRVIGIADPGGAAFGDKEAKLEELAALLEHLVILSRDLVPEDGLRLLDLACGRSYLSFGAYFLLREHFDRPVHVIGVDSDERLVGRCIAAAQELGYTDMEFHAARIADLPVTGRVDIAYSLHACDTATDEALARCVQTRARRFLAVPCCRWTTRKLLSRKTILRPLTRHKVGIERFADLLADALRASLLEAVGYDVTMLEFASVRVTPQNVMLRGLYKGQPHKGAYAEYLRLKDEFAMAPALEGLLAEELAAMNDGA